MLASTKLLDVEVLATEERKAQIREAQKRLRAKQKQAGIADRTFKVSKADIENAEKIKKTHKLKSLDAAVSLALKTVANDEEGK
jgi:hypothetical protein